MSSIAPDKQAIIKELYSRRDTLDPDKRAIVEELASRMGTSTPAPAPTPAEPWYARMFSGKDLPIVPNIAIGAAKGVLDRIRQGGDWIREKSPFLDSLPSIEVNAPITPSNPAQSLGHTLERGGEFALAGEATAGLTAGTALPIRAAAQGATAYGVGRSQGQTPNEALVSGALGAAAPVISDYASPAWKAIKSKFVSAESVNKWMDVPAKEVMHGANPGQQLIDEKLIGGTKEATKAKVASALGDASQKMQTALQDATNQGVKINAENFVLDALDTTKRIGGPRDATHQANISGILDDILKRYPNIDRLTPVEAHSLKAELGDSIKWAGQAYDTPINQAMVQIYRDLNTAIKGNVKGIGPLQQRWGNLYIATKNLAESMADDLVGKGTGAMAPGSAGKVLSGTAPGLLKKAGYPLAGYGIYKEITKP